MKVLVTGGTGVVGRAAVRSLREKGHIVRLLSRHADADLAEWPDGVEARTGSVSVPHEVTGTADGCDAILHVAGIVRESPPDVTFENTNVDGTRYVVAEAVRAGVTRLVYVSSLGADQGESDYHRSKRSAESIVREFDRNWTIVRPGNVYGPGDDVLSLLLKMVRTLPAIPVISGGDQPFEPIWMDDLGAALAETIERTDLAGRVLEVGGPDRTSMNDVLRRFESITGRSPAHVPVPAAVARIGSQLAGMFGVELPVGESQLVMLEEGNIVRAAEGNALTTVLSVPPTSLDDGLRRLADSLPAQQPGDGVGSLRRKRFWAEIDGSRMSAEVLCDTFCQNFASLTPEHLVMGAEPGTTLGCGLAYGETITMALPVRGHVQVRVIERAPCRATLVTIEGHPLAGSVSFVVETRGSRLHFQIEVVQRAATMADWIALSIGGDQMQNATWTETVEAVVRTSGGQSSRPVQQDETTLSDDEAARVDEWVRSLIAAHRRTENAQGVAGEPVGASAR